ncbi:MAG: alanine racemase [Candidatus Omnitrophica bacterium]|nr:alanine racemase [Candidatus Omnitrophota bacterium]
MSTTAKNPEQKILPEPLTWIDIDLKALVHNWNQLNKLAASNMSHNAGIMPVIKADAYGHGMIPVAQALSDNGCKFFGVSNVHEGIALRDAGFKQKILLFESTLPQDAAAIIEHQLIPTVCNLDLAHKLDDIAKSRNEEIPIHIKVDTGMGRLGIAEGDVVSFVKDVQSQYKNIKLDGIYTHFPVADTDRDFTFAQMRRFRDLVFTLENQFITFTYVHAGNSMGLGDYKSELFNLARPGLMLYGLYPSVELKMRIHLKPVMSVKSKIIFVKAIKKGQGVSYGHTFKAKEDMTIAVLPIGYSNGYLRALSNKSFVLIHGVRCPLIGRVTMDQTIIDISALALSAKVPHVGEEVVLIGHQKDQMISCDDVAHWAGTISYEIVCSLGSRLPRIFSN